MRLPPAGREYVHGTITGAPNGATVQVSLDGSTWVAATRTVDDIAVLVAGPSATGNPVGTLVLPLGRSLLKVRVSDTPEDVIRDWGPVDVG